MPPLECDKEFVDIELKFLVEREEEVKEGKGLKT